MLALLLLWCIFWQYAESVKNDESYCVKLLWLFFKINKQRTCKLHQFLESWSLTLFSVDLLWFALTSDLGLLSIRGVCSPHRQFLGQQSSCHRSGINMIIKPKIINRVPPILKAPKAISRKRKSTTANEWRSKMTSQYTYTCQVYYNWIGVAC